MITFPTLVAGAFGISNAIFAMYLWSMRDIEDRNVELVVENDELRDQVIILLDKVEELETKNEVIRNYAKIEK